MVSEACRVVGISRTVVYQERQRDEVFAVQWADVEEKTTEAMEREAYRRGVEGVEKPVYQGGKLVGRVNEYSDTLLIFMLKARRPDKYRENVKVEHGGTVTHRVPVDLKKLSDEQIAQLEAIAKQLDDGG